MDLFFAIFFQALYFIRPQDWIPGMAGARLVALNTLALLGATAMRADGFKVKDLVRTPIEVGMIIYLGYVIYASKEPWDTAKELRTYYLFFILTILALPTIDRVQRYLVSWMWVLFGLCGIAILTAAGVDITRAQELITAMQGRLCINTWMHNNPNALGHTLVVLISLVYFWHIWKRPFTRKLGGICLLLPVLYAIYATQSKGSYIVGLITFLTAILFGRSKMFKIVAIGLAVGLGGTALSQLPRMQNLSRREQGVQGRLMAWEMARIAMLTNPKGVGWDKFVAVFYWEGEYVQKATHSSYIQIGAALGKPGLLLYMGMLWCGLRGILFAPVRTEQERRVQGMLYAIYVPFCLSNWMIDRAYHTEFFTLLAAVSAFHRVVGLRLPTMLAGEQLGKAPKPAFHFGSWAPPALHPAGESAAAGPVYACIDERQKLWDRGGARFSPVLDAPVAPHPAVSEETDEKVRPKKPWRRIGIVDMIMAYVLYRVIVEAWEYIMKNF
jgi:O-antigen ligase